MSDKAREQVVASGAGAVSAAAGRPSGGTTVAPHTRPGDQNALCIETDQA